MYSGYFDARLKIPLLHYSHDYRTDAARFCYSSGDNALGDHLWSGRAPLVEMPIEGSKYTTAVHPLRAGLLLFGLSPLRQRFLGQRGSGRLGLHHDAGDAPSAGVFDRLNAVDAARDLLAVAVQRVAAP